MIYDVIDGSVYKSDMSALGITTLMVSVLGSIIALVTIDIHMSIASTIVSVIAGVMIACGWYQEMKMVTK